MSRPYIDHVWSNNCETNSERFPSLHNIAICVLIYHDQWYQKLWIDHDACSSALRKTITLQKRAVRTINRAAFNSHTDPLFNRSRILKISDLYQSHIQVLIFMYDFVHHNLPRSFDDSFHYTCNYEIQNLHQTRQSGQLYIPRCQSNFAGN